ncbi:MAG: phage terminase large subunit family protein [Acidobacteria bacterium]|nr:phage terminase large subunit family protein [Acidobacteriota bacterium]
MSQIAKSLELLCRSCVSPPPDLTVSQWADQYRYLSSESAAEHGKWSTLPFQREPLDSVSDPCVYRTVIRAATQMLKTVTIENGIGYFAHQDPGPILVLQPRDADAKAFSKERIAPMIRDTPVLKNIFAESKGRTSNSTIEEKLFRGGMLAITSAGSPGNLARRAIRFLFADEVDKYPPTAGSEGNPISLARKRLATFRHRKKEILTCSPTLPGSEIDRAYEASDKREYYVPCPACGHMQSMMLKFYTQVRWDSKLSSREEQARSARYHCENPDCSAAWDDAARWKAVELGEWRASRPFNGIAGFWISELYSPWKQLSEIVLDYLSKKDSAEDLKTFVNTSMAENWIEKGEAPEWEMLLSRREDYQPGTVPRGGLFLTSGVDVHPDRLEAEVVAWGRGRESWSVDYQIFEGKTSEPEVWKKLEALRSQTYRTESGAEIPISRMFVDSGDQTQDVYNWVRTQPSSQVQAIKGSDKGILPVGQPTPVEVTVGGRKIKAGVKIKIINVSFFKSDLYANLKSRRPTEEELEQGYTFPPGYCHFPTGKNYGDEHFKQLCAEQLVSHRNRRSGRTKQEWQQTRPRNEALDCRIYARAAAWDKGLDRMQERHFRSMEDQLKIAHPAAAQSEQQSQAQPENAQPGLRMDEIRNQGYFRGRNKNWFNR